MKFFVVSEEELDRLTVTQRLEYRTRYEGDEKSNKRAAMFMEQAVAACRARPVPEWATEFAGPVSDEYENNDHFSIHRKIQRIKR